MATTEVEVATPVAALIGVVETTFGITGGAAVVKVQE